MRVLHFTYLPYKSTYGGLEIYLRTLLPHQARTGLAVGHASIHWSTEENNVFTQSHHCEDGIECFELSVPKRNYEKLCDTQIIKHIKQIIQEYAPDLCHLHHGMVSQVISACRECNLPICYTIHTPEVFCINGLLLRNKKEPCDGVASYKKCLGCCGDFLQGGRYWGLLLKLCPQMVNQLLQRMFEGKSIPFLSTLYDTRRVLLNTLNSLISIATVNVIIAPSEAVAALAKKQGCLNNIVTVPHCIPDSPRLPYPSLQDGIVHFYYVGRICFYKGIHMLLDAFASVKHDNWRLHLIGDATLRVEKKYAGKLKKKYTSQNIIWHGRLPHEQLPATIAGCHIMVHPAMFFEIFGLTIAEALSMGRPVITTACGGPEMQVQDGVNGWIVERNNPEMLAEKVEWLLGHPEALLEMNKHCSVPKYETHLAQLRDIYNSLLT